ncbi:YciI family protein [Paraglaciecola chathamensis]|uniref:YciI family protein n=1 Tax=Paraglaciecola chathamensis TaxID=368405 RepID=UPI0026FD39F2|nr:YciI family protein [Paraglaciecola chathamensis]MDO6560467.1 YciI family protein [Paraglaciecola chathamensis]
MLVQFHCVDKTPSQQDKRLENLGAHLAWVESNMAQICVAGPLKQDEQIVGSLYILDASTVQQAKTLLFSDPYYLADIWASIKIQTFNAYAGTWVGGKNWPT